LIRLIENTQWWNKKENESMVLCDGKGNIEIQKYVVCGHKMDLQCSSAVAIMIRPCNDMGTRSNMDGLTSYCRRIVDHRSDRRYYMWYTSK